MASGCEGKCDEVIEGETSRSMATDNKPVRVDPWSEVDRVPSKLHKRTMYSSTARDAAQGSLLPQHNMPHPRTGSLFVSRVLVIFFSRATEVDSDMQFLQLLIGAPGQPHQVGEAIEVQLPSTGSQGFDAVPGRIRAALCISDASPRDR